MNNNNNSGIILFLLWVILTTQFRMCDKIDHSLEPKNLIDTQYVYFHKDTVIMKYVTLLKRDTVHLPGDSVFIPDTCYESLKAQYESLAASYSVRNIYSDTLLIDTFGHVLLYDTIQYNRLKQHQYQLKYSIPVVTRTVTIVPPPKAQVYVGSGLSVNASLNKMSLQAGILYKTKQDHIYGGYLLTDGTSVPQFGVSSYWKLKLK
jgi:hypothetical protein